MIHKNIPTVIKWYSEKKVSERKGRRTNMKKRAFVMFLLFTVIFSMLFFTVSCADGTNEEMNTSLLPMETDAESPEAEKFTDVSEEIRGVYIATAYNINFPSRQGLSAEKLAEELDEIVENVKSAGLNAIFFQVRPSSDAMYDSDIFPVSEYLTGKTGGELPNGFDPLEYIIKKAHENGIELHAWVNPLRVTRGSLSNPKTDISSLPEGHPARLMPEMTVSYAGELYYDPGMPEVRELVADGVLEIVKNYDVDGIMFDDYFYPYPETDENGQDIVFDDSLSYSLYGEGYEKDDFRRENINRLVKLCYDAVKSVDVTCRFGIAPFGIWQNDDGSNGGSATSGMEAYSAIYCDAVAWVEGGYVDYLAPQIYWNFSKKSASYSVLADFWNKNLDGTGIDLYISHAAYKYGTDEWQEAGTVDEITAQISYARELISYKGSIFYGYSALCENIEGILDETETVYKDSIVYTSPVKTGTTVNIVYPQNGYVTNSDTVTVKGESDPAVTVKFGGKKISRKKDGTFILEISLKDGEYILEFYSGNEKYVLTINKTS